MKRTWQVLSMGLAAGIAATSAAQSFPADVDGLEVFYGGFVGDFSELAKYDFGKKFPAVEAATLHLQGVTDLHGSTLTFVAALEGVEAPPVEILAETEAFAVAISLPVSPAVLDGHGIVALEVYTSAPGGADLGSLVTEAVLVFDVPGCPADVTGDGVVNVGDLTAVVLAWGTCGDRDCPADVDGDGTVAVSDLVQVILEWGACS